MASARTAAPSTVVHMPFTLSHPALVLPLRRTGLPMAALVCGSMAPDLHMILPGVSDTATHSWKGVATIDLALALALTAAWVAVLGPTCRAAAPRWVLERLLPAPRYGWGTWALAVVAAVVGAATHVAWDTFTHAHMWGGEHIAWLYEMHHGHPGYQWAQYVSSAGGLIVIAIWAAWTLRGRTPRPAQPPEGAVGARLALGLPLVLGTLLATVVVVYLVRFEWNTTDFVVASGVRTLLVVTCVGAVIAALAWRAWSLRDG